MATVQSAPVAKATKAAPVAKSNHPDFNDYLAEAVVLGEKEGAGTDSWPKLFHRIHDGAMEGVITSDTKKQASDGRDRVEEMVAAFLSGRKTNMEVKELQANTLTNKATEMRRAAKLAENTAIDGNVLLASIKAAVIKMPNDKRPKTLNAYSTVLVKQLSDDHKNKMLTDKQIAGFLAKPAPQAETATDYWVKVEKLVADMFSPKDKTKTPVDGSKECGAILAEIRTRLAKVRTADDAARNSAK